MHDSASLQPTTMRLARLRKNEERIRAGVEKLLDMAVALEEIRINEQWRDDPEIRYFGFDDYCLRKWHFTPSHVYFLIRGGKIIREMTARAARYDEHPDRPLPSTQGQVRELERVRDFDDRDTVWETARERHGDRPTGPQVRAVRLELFPPPDPPPITNQLLANRRADDNRIAALETISRSFTADECTQLDDYLTLCEVQMRRVLTLRARSGGVT